MLSEQRAKVKKANGIRLADSHRQFHKALWRIYTSHSYGTCPYRRHHTGERPFKCEQCDKSFAVKAALKDHVRVHTGERPYTCDACSKSFTSSGALRIHKMIHAGLSVCLFGCLSVCLSVFLSVCLSGCLFVWLSACLPACLPACQPSYLPVCLSVCLSVLRSKNANRAEWQMCCVKLTHQCRNNNLHY